ncbi:hypothetical protein BSKO_09996 [Bryopsis sp. KO-2023]|nr:hypothetical protein BSKO_09996 [Bryopsis sp. KO-2023]
MSFGGFNSNSGFGSSAPSFGFGGGSLSPGFGGASSSPGFGGGLFGSSQPSGFGAASSGTSLFGGGSGFGGGGGGGVFGSGSSSPFGNTTNSTSMFGGASSTGVFGSSSPFGGNSSFGNPSSAPFGGSTFGGGGFGQSTINGTTQVPFSAPQESESGAHGRNALVSYQNISTMKQYQNFSVEELREQDYKAGNKGGPGGGAGGAFGGNMGNTSVFGASSGIGGVNFGASSGAFGGGMGGTSTFGQSTSQTSLFGGGGGFGATAGGPFGQSSTSTFGASSPAFGATGGTGGLFSGGNTSGFGASSGFGGFGAASSAPAGTGLFGGATTGGFGAASSSPSLFGGAPPGQTSNVFNSGTGFGVQSSGGAFGRSTFGSTFGAASSGGFGIGQSSGPSLFGASTGSMFGTGTTNAFGGAGASSGSLFGGATTPSLFGTASTSTNLFGASSGGGLMGANSGMGQTTSLFGGASQPAQGFGAAPAQPQMNWGGQNALVTGMAQNPQNFSDLYGRIAPELPQNGADGSQVKVGLKAMVPRTPRKKFNRRLMLATWSREWQAERRKQAFKAVPNQAEISWWGRSREGTSVDVFGARPSSGEDENQEGNTSDGVVWSYVKPKESNLIPKAVDRLLTLQDDKIDQPEDGARPVSEGGERMLTQKEIEERLPKITEEDFFIKPNIQGLRNMLRGDPNALKEVHGLVIGRKGYGKIRYDVPINLEGVDICKCVSFKKGGVTFGIGDDKPNPLNGAGEVTVEAMYLMDKEKKPLKDEAAVKKMRNHLMRYCKAEGLQFVSYEEGVWRFKADSLS